jgi:ERI1 exoribonuclease 3
MESASCCYFRKGKCSYGTNCKLLHVNNIPCQFGSSCKFGHATKKKVLEEDDLFLPKKYNSDEDDIVFESDDPSEVNNNSIPKQQKQQPFDFYLVLDLEGKIEILEFPVLLINPETLKTESVFHRYVLPTKMKKVADSNLLKIQEEIESYVKNKYGPWGIDKTWFEKAILFKQVLDEFEDWIQKEIGSKTFAFVTCGNWDIKTQIPHQCTVSELPLKLMWNRWINIKDVFLNFYHKKAPGMSSMLSRLGIELEGNHHSGIDDVKNIAKVFVQMVEDGASFDITGSRGADGIVSYAYKKRI